MKLLNAIEMTDVNGGAGDEAATAAAGAIGLGAILHVPHAIIGFIESYNYFVKASIEGCPVATADDLLTGHDPYNGDHLRRHVCEILEYLKRPRD